MSESAELLRKARALLVERGWCRADTDPQGRLCAGSALCVAAGYPPVAYLYGGTVEDAWFSLINARPRGFAYTALPFINDNLKDKRTVLRWFDRAIALSNRDGGQDG